MKRGGVRPWTTEAARDEKMRRMEQRWQHELDVDLDNNASDIWTYAHNGRAGTVQERHDGWWLTVTAHPDKRELGDVRLGGARDVEHALQLAEQDMTGWVEPYVETEEERASRVAYEAEITEAEYGY